MTLNDERPAFTPEQISELKMLGVIDEQISHLERDLPLIKGWLNSPAKMSDVRVALKALADLLDKTAKAIELRLTDHSFDLAGKEARTRVQIAAVDYDESPYGHVLSEALDAIRPALMATNSALKDLPNKRRQPSTADPFVIERIHQAITRGWGEKYNPVRDHDSNDPSPPSPRPQPTDKQLYPFEVSHSEAKFKGVARIVFDVCLGKDNHDPAAAIRAYLSDRNAALRRGSETQAD